MKSYRAEIEKDARSAYQRFQDRYQAKYPKAFENLMKDESSFFTFITIQLNTSSISVVPMSLSRHPLDRTPYGKNSGSRHHDNLSNGVHAV
jgi:hypothetical protein